VILRGLTINNQGSTGNGVTFNSGGTLHIESCIANGFSSASGNGGLGSAGIAILGPGEIVVKSTIARGNSFGVFVDLTTGGTANVAMDQLRLEANNNGLGVGSLGGGPVNAAIRNSSLSGNGNDGVLVDGQTGGAAALDIESCLISNNGAGIEVDTFEGTGSASVSNCTVTRNPMAGIALSGSGILYSLGNNTFTGNGANLGSSTPLPAQ
jgi:hypothetical protein